MHYSQSQTRDLQQKQGVSGVFRNRSKPHLLSTKNSWDVAVQSWV